MCGAGPGGFGLDPIVATFAGSNATRRPTGVEPIKATGRRPKRAQGRATEPGVPGRGRRGQGAQVGGAIGGTLDTPYQPTLVGGA